jgi:hypothetical protein
VSDLAGQWVRALPRGGQLAVDVADAAPIADAAARERAEREWARRSGENPRLFDGPILRVVSTDPERGLVRAERAGFKHLVTREASGVECTILSVTGVIVGRDARGREHVLLGRRSGQTRIYGGMWELGPSGGLTPPPPGVTTIGLDAVLAQLREEGLEELGLDLAGARCEPVCLALDELAGSDDIVVRVTPPGPIDPRRLPCRTGACSDWEYIDTAWVPLDGLAAFDAASPDAIIPPTRALWRWFGWV